MDHTVEQMHAVVEEQRREIDYLQNMLDNLTRQRRGDTHGWLLLQCDHSVLFLFLNAVLLIVTTLTG